LSSQILVKSANTTLAKRQLFESFKDRGYRFAFVPERVRSSVALQIRALREQRNHMTQKQLGDAMGKAQTWISQLENPDYGKMSVTTLLRLAKEFDTDLEIKFRPFSTTIDTLPDQGPEYFTVPSFEEEKVDIEAKITREESLETTQLTAEQADTLARLSLYVGPPMAGIGLYNPYALAYPPAYPPAYPNSYPFDFIGGMGLGPSFVIPPISISEDPPKRAEVVDISLYKKGAISIEMPEGNFYEPQRKPA
jgi:transcriptional regulator with XRE-family HTH domain